MAEVDTKDGVVNRGAWTPNPQYNGSRRYGWCSPLSSFGTDAVASVGRFHYPVPCNSSGRWSIHYQGYRFVFAGHGHTEYFDCFGMQF